MFLGSYSGPIESHSVLPDPPGLLGGQDCIFATKKTTNLFFSLGVAVVRDHKREVAKFRVRMSTTNLVVGIRKSFCSHGLPMFAIYAICIHADERPKWKAASVRAAY